MLGGSKPLHRLQELNVLVRKIERLDCFGADRRSRRKLVTYNLSGNVSRENGTPLIGLQGRHGTNQHIRKISFCGQIARELNSDFPLYNRADPVSSITIVWVTSSKVLHFCLHRRTAYQNTDKLGETEVYEDHTLCKLPICLPR